MIENLIPVALTSVLLIALWQYLRWDSIKVTPTMIGATFPWFGVVGAAYAVQQGTSVPHVVDPLIGTPTAYLTVGIVVFVLWIAVDRIRPGSEAKVTTASGLIVLTVVVLVISATQFDRGSEVLFWNGVAIVLAISITALVRAIFRFRKASIGSGWLSESLVFAHVLDATTTGIGLEVLGTVERNPIAASIISSGDTVPIAGSGVLVFLLVKILVALLVVAFVVESPDLERENTALLVLAGGVGLTPAIHNLVLFSLTVP